MTDTRPCSCAPDERPYPCQHQYALRLCRKAEIRSLRAERDALQADLAAARAERDLAQTSGVEHANYWQEQAKDYEENSALFLKERDYAMEMVNVQDNQIDALRALLKVAQDCIYSLDAREIYADELARIDAALKDKP